MLRQVKATRYATPLREGGSLPGIMEADDLGTWVVKFSGAGQGVKSLVAEVVVGELARELGFDVPELVVVDVDPLLGRAEPDQEIQELLRASPGPNLGMDYLPGSITYDPLAFAVDPDLAARVLWLDAYVLNVDRSWRNPNLLVWGRKLWLIDHGAALYPHHDWSRAGASATRALPRWEEHVLLGALDDPAARLLAADAMLAPRVDESLLRDVVGRVPVGWLPDGDVERSRYVEWLSARLATHGSGRSDGSDGSQGSDARAGVSPRPWLTAMTGQRPAARQTGRAPDWLTAPSAVFAPPAGRPQAGRGD